MSSTKGTSQEDGSVFVNHEELLQNVLTRSHMDICEYLVRDDRFLIYNEHLKIRRDIPHYMDYLREHSVIHPEDREKARAFLLGRTSSEVELRLRSDAGGKKVHMHMFPPLEGVDPSIRLMLIVKDDINEIHRATLLEKLVQRDPLTNLYNQSFGREFVNEFLKQKDPYATCGMMMVDLDYFKFTNDTYGHLFGNQVLTAVSRLLQKKFDRKCMVMRAGGDEFVIFLEDISHAALVKKAKDLVESIQKLRFSNEDFSITCSIGVCFLMENTSGYTYDQLFENADWALYRAKENGRNRYVFCDNLQRFEEIELSTAASSGIDVRYLHNDIISTAFEIFEKSSSFSVAVKVLMEVIGYRFGLDRITIVRTDVKGQTAGRQYQWCSQYAPEVLEQPGSFTREDFLTLFQSYDEHQTTVLQCDNMGQYSPAAAALLMQGGAKTVLYAAMYCEGSYIGAISYVVCREKRRWSQRNRIELSEVTKIISAHLARTQVTNVDSLQSKLWMEYDSLTGLLSFSRFMVDAEHLIVGRFADSHVMISTDLAGFKYFNQKYGYHAGDQLLKELAAYMLDWHTPQEGIFFARSIADQFLMLTAYSDVNQIVPRIEACNREFERLQSQKFQGAMIHIRTGVYFIESDCPSASVAIDAANYARKQVVSSSSAPSVRIYDEEMKEKQKLESEIVNGIDQALKEGQFQIYLQPKFSLRDGSVIGAEALVRWRTREGKILLPDAFIPICEASGRIEALDFYVFDLVTQFLARNQQLGRRQVPISVNASILHASNPNAVRKYLDILERYHVDPQYMEIELTETATVDKYESVKQWFQALHKAGIRTAMDDFGAGYSVMNSILNVPVDTVKLDRGFVQNCEMDSRSTIFLKNVIGMLKDLGYHVICEGVETPAQASLLLEAGCEEGQGYLFSKPLPVDEYEKFVYTSPTRGRHAG